MAFDQVVQQLRGRPAIDWRGMTPEQIAAISGQGQQATAQSMQLMMGLRGQDIQQEQFERTEQRQAEQFEQQQQLARDRMQYEQQKDLIDQQWKELEFGLKKEMHEMDLRHKSAQTNASNMAAMESRFRFGVLEQMSKVMVPTNLGDMPASHAASLRQMGMPLDVLSENLMTQVVEANGRQVLVQVSKGMEITETDLGAARHQGKWFQDPKSGENQWVPDGENPPPGFMFVPTVNIEAGPEHAGMTTFERKLGEVRARTADPKFTQDMMDQFRQAKPGMLPASSSPASTQFVEANAALGKHVQETLQTIWRDFGRVAHSTSGPFGPGFYLIPHDDSEPYIIHRDVLHPEFYSRVQGQ